VSAVQNPFRTTQLAAEAFPPEKQACPPVDRGAWRDAALPPTSPLEECPKCDPESFRNPIRARRSDLLDRLACGLAIGCALAGYWLYYTCMTAMAV